MEPTLTLTLPLIFLGHTTILHPSPSPFTLLSALQTFCPTISIHLITPTSPIPPSDTTWTLSASGPALTPAEHALLPGGIWAVPVTFERRGIPIRRDTVECRVFQMEVGGIFGFLAQLAGMRDKIPGCVEPQQWWSLLSPSACLATLTLVPDGTASLPLKLVGNVLVVVAALERELTLLSTPSVLREFWGLARWLEYRAVRSLAKEKSALWKDVRSDKRKPESYRREKAKWMASFSDEEHGFQRMQGRARECWDVVASCNTADLVKELASFEGRMGVEVALGGEDVDADVEAISFPSHHGPSTPCLAHILAYTSLISSLLHISTSHSLASLSSFLEAHRETAPSEPVDAFAHMLDTLGVDKQDKEFWAEVLRTTGSVPAATSSPPSLFDALSTHLTLQHNVQRDQIHTFVARYTSVGGFLPTPTKKVYALLLADEHARRDRSQPREGEDKAEWMGGIEEKVRVREAWEGEDATKVKGRKSPELGAGERLRRDRMVREALGR